MSTRRDFVATGALAASSLVALSPGSAVAAEDPQKSTEIPSFLLLPKSKDIGDIFDKAVDDFNKRKWDDLGVLLDDNVRVVSVSGTTIKQGRANVIKYLKDDIAADNPNFQPVGTSTTYNLTISGIALWTDHDLPGKGKSIGIVTYIFTFKVYSDPPYRILTMYASPDSPS